MLTNLPKQANAEAAKVIPKNIQDLLKDPEPSLPLKIPEDLPDSVLHSIAGPPYDNPSFSLPNDAPTILPKRQNKPTKTNNRLTYIDQELERLRILLELRKLDEEESKLKSKKDKNKFAGILNLPNVGETVDRFSNALGLDIFDDQQSYSSGSHGSPSVLSLSLSRTDFMYELTNWFRRSIWFLAFTGAYILSPTILVLTALLALAFELTLNFGSARSYYDDFMGHFNGDYLGEYIDDYSWRPSVAQASKISEIRNKKASLGLNKSLLSNLNVQNINPLTF